VDSSEQDKRIPQRPIFSCLLKVKSPCNRNVSTSNTTSRDIDQPSLLDCTTAMNNHFLSISSCVISESRQIFPHENHNLLTDTSPHGFFKTKLDTFQACLRNSALFDVIKGFPFPEERGEIP
jgi:hypothetical protein